MSADKDGDLPVGKKERIQEAALRAFTQKGFEGSTIAEIAAAAGVAEGTIYNYYKNKQDLLIAVLEDAIITEEFVSGIQSPPKDISTLLRSLAEERLRFGLANAEILRLIITEVRRDPDLRKRYYERVVRRGSQLLENFVANEIANGAVRDLNPRLVARAMLANIIGLVLVGDLERQVIGETFDAGEIAEMVSAIYLRGILRNQA